MRVQPALDFLNHRINHTGISPLARLEAIEKSPQPHDIRSMREVLGLVNFLSSIITNYAALLQPLHSLLSVRKDQPFDPSPTPFPPLCQERPTFRSFIHFIPSSLSGKTNLSILHPLYSLLSVRKDQPFNPSPTSFPPLKKDQPSNHSPTSFPPLCQERPTFQSFTHFIPSSLLRKTNLSILLPLHSLLSVRKDQPFDP